jgi:hypothetical protein
VGQQKTHPGTPPVGQSGCVLTEAQKSDEHSDDQKLVHDVTQIYVQSKHLGEGQINHTSTYPQVSIISSSFSALLLA